MTSKPLKLLTFVIAVNFSCELSSDELESYQKIFDYDVNMLICYGQSNSSGANATDNNTDFRNTISFIGGCNESISDVNINDPSSVSNFYGNKFVDINSLNREDWPPISAIAVTWMDLLEKEDKIDISNHEKSFLLSTPGSRGSTIDALLKDTDYYQRLLFSVKKATEFSEKSNKTIGVPCLFWVQGESDMIYPESEYYKKLKTLFNNLNTDIKKITQQKKDVIFIISQTATVIGNTRNYSDGSSRVFQDSGPSFAQMRLIKEEKNVYLGGAMYQYEYEDFWHPKDLAVVGIQSGIIAKRIFSDNSRLYSDHS